MTTKEELEQLKKQFAELEAKIAQEEKQEIKTVEDAFKKLRPDWYIDEHGTIESIIFQHHFKFKDQQCNMTSEKEAKRMKALIQLRLIAEAMNEGVESKYLDTAFSIDLEFKIAGFTKSYLVAKLLPIFNTQELAQQALTNFKPLFEDLYAE